MYKGTALSEWLTPPNRKTASHSFPKYLQIANYLLLSSADKRNKTALNTVKQNLTTKCSLLKIHVCFSLGKWVSKSKKVTRGSNNGKFLQLPTKEQHSEKATCKMTSSLLALNSSAVFLTKHSYLISHRQKPSRDNPGGRICPPRQTVTWKRNVFFSHHNAKSSHGWGCL